MNDHLTETDKKIWEEELDSFLPHKMIDVHTHIWNERFAAENKDADSILRMNAGLEDLRNFSRMVFPGREIHYLIMGTPLSKIDFEGHNNWVAEEASQDPESLSAMIVTPRMPQEYLSSMIREKHFKVLKPYRIFAGDPVNCRIRDYFPETFMEVADHNGLAVMLHLSRLDGAADPVNLEDLKSYTSKYPNIKWILAHCARSFNSFMLEKSIHFLKDLPNLYYDTSAVNDLYSHLLLLKYEDKKRIMFGSDNIAAGGMRGKYISYAFAWEGYRGNPSLSHCRPEAAMVIYEQLRCQKQAFDILGLMRSEVDLIFYGNAQKFFQSLGM